MVDIKRDKESINMFKLAKEGRIQLSKAISTFPKLNICPTDANEESEK